MWCCWTTATTSRTRLDHSKRAILPRQRARALGVRLAGIRNLSEGGGYAPPQPQMLARAAMAMDSAESTSVAPGELTVRINISGVYDIVR